MQTSYEESEWGPFEMLTVAQGTYNKLVGLYFHLFYVLTRYDFGPMLGKRRGRFVGWVRCTWC